MFRRFYWVSVSFRVKLNGFWKYFLKNLAIRPRKFQSKRVLKRFLLNLNDLKSRCNCSTMRFRKAFLKKKKNDISIIGSITARFQFSIISTSPWLVNLYAYEYPYKLIISRMNYWYINCVILFVCFFFLFLSKFYMGNFAADS